MITADRFVFSSTLPVPSSDFLNIPELSMLSMFFPLPSEAYSLLILDFWSFESA